MAVVPNLVQDSSLSKRILSDLRASIPVITPFEIKKRVALQEAYDKGRPIFSYEPPNAVKQDDAHELKKGLHELETCKKGLTGIRALPIERDLYFKPRRLSEVKKEHEGRGE